MLGELLKLYRRVGGLSGREMAEKFGVSQTTYMRLEGGRNVDTRTFLKVIRVLFPDADDDNEKTAGD